MKRKCFGGTWGRRCLGPIALASILTAVALSASPGAALAAPPTLWSACEISQPEGQRCQIPRGIAADPGSGHVFVGDQENKRVVEFTAHGQFVRAWGWDVVKEGPGDTGVGFEVCEVPDDVCNKAGVSGAGAGQFASPQGLAVDSVGDVYVVDRPNHRVQKFDSHGNFLLMFGGGVNQGGGTPENPGDICTAEHLANGDVCGAGATGAANGQFSASWVILGDYIAIDGSDKVYVGDVNRIQRFDTDGVWQANVPLPGEAVQSLDTDPAGSLYAIYSGKADVRKITPAGAELVSPRFVLKDPEGTVVKPFATAVDAEGNVYAFGPISFQAGRPMDPIFKFDPAGGLIEKFGKGEYAGSTGLATNLCPGNESPGDLYVSNAASSSSGAFVRAHGTPPTNCGQAITSPASNVVETAATLNGKVNPKGEAILECAFEYGLDKTYGQSAPCTEPSAGEIEPSGELVPVHADIAGLEAGTVYHFRLAIEIAAGSEAGSDETFKTLGPPVISGEHTESTAFTEASVKALVNPEGLQTSCRFEYGLSEGSYPQSTAPFPVGSDRSAHAVGDVLQGLAPGTTYHWRIVCENVSGTTEGQDRIATTHVQVPLDTECPNQAHRTAAAAFLPDCRAYEMVSPVDKNGGDIISGVFDGGDPHGYAQTSPDGDKMAYTALTTFADQPAGFRTNQYLAEREEGGWGTHGIHPPVTGTPVDAASFGLVREFMAFTPDLCSAWVVDFQTPTLSADAQQGYRNLYRRENCGASTGGLEALTTGPPPLPQGTAAAYVTNTSVQGASDDARHALFVAEAPLVQDCRTTTTAEEISYRWLRNGAPIEGATSAVYRPTAADAGTAIQCQVFAINANAGSTQVSNPAAVIPPEAGVAISPPVAPGGIFPPAQSAPLTVGGPGGQTLTCNPLEAFWEGSPTFSYRWYRNGAPVEGATASTYLVSEADLAAPAVFQCAVTGTNGDGGVTKLSNNRATSPAPSGPAAPVVNASNGGELGRVFDRFGGANHLVSVLPNGSPAGAESVVGSGWGGSLEGAVSADGSRVFWTTGNGRILQRRHPERAEDCEDPAKACTTQVGGALLPAFFWRGSGDGTRALFQEESPPASGKTALFVFDENAPKRQVAADIEGVAGASDDLGRIYFVSEQAIEGAGQNSGEDEASEGEPNLYLDAGGTVRFVATLLDGDVGAKEEGFPVQAYDLRAHSSYLRATRITPDGARIAFQSRAPLTGFDNTDAEGKPAVEVFSYEAGNGEFTCVSCNPGGARPATRELPEPYRQSGQGNPTGVNAAAWIPTWEHPTHASNVLSEDGNRIFFNSNDPLLPRDSNGTQDVYEWEAPGTGGCDETDPDYFAQNGGCLYLISSGKSPFESEFWEASPDGDDVFFTTESSLLPQDPGLIDLYDARVDGGFPQPVQIAPCEGEACQSPLPPPQFSTPSSEAFEGPGNPQAKPKKRRCPKGKRKARRAGKVVCVKKRGKGAKHRRGANARRRAER